MEPARGFVFVPFEGVAAPETICCDGLVEGSRLHLSHWEGNATPDRYRADTSVEIALRFNDAPDPAVAGWPVVNNHFDTDGALAVWTLRFPTLAARHRALLVAAAESGDFEEWNDDDGVRLDLAVRALTHGLDDAEAYHALDARLPRWLGELGDAHALWSAQGDVVFCNRCGAFTCGGKVVTLAAACRGSPTPGGGAARLARLTSGKPFKGEGPLVPPTPVI